MLSSKLLINCHRVSGLTVVLSDRLLDVCPGQQNAPERCFFLYLVFEHMEQDLATYLERCPSPGLGPERIRVCLTQSD